VKKPVHPAGVTKQPSVTEAEKRALVEQGVSVVEVSLGSGVVVSEKGSPNVVVVEGKAQPTPQRNPVGIQKRTSITEPERRELIRQGFSIVEFKRGSGIKVEDTHDQSIVVVES
jgi:hypothetical protein